MSEFPSRWVVVFAVWAALLCGSLHGQEENDRKAVLALFATGRQTQIAALGDRELPSILDRELPGGLDYYSDFFDVGRFPDVQYQQAFREYFRIKYRGRRLDVVIAMHDDVLDFLSRNRDELFPGVPVVFFGASSGNLGLPNSTGIISDLDFRSTLALATSLQPDTRHVYVVSGASPSDRIYEQTARQQFQSFEPGLTFTYFSGLPTAELERQLATLPTGSIVYYLLVYLDGAGEEFQPLDYLDRIAVVANRPIYSWVDSTIGHGVVGGSMKSQKAQVAAVGALAVRVLRGESADRIPVSTPPLQVDVVDWRELRRWRISEARIPAGTSVLFREPGAWERYAVYILGGAGLLIGQAALIAGMLVHSRRRRRVERQLRSSQAELQESEERFRLLSNSAPVMIWLSGPNKQCTDVNRQWLEFTGRPLEAELGNGWVDGVHPEDRERVLAAYNDAFERRQPFQTEYRIRRHDGEYRWVLDTGVPRLTPDGLLIGYVGSVIDFTDVRVARVTLANLSRKLMEAHEQERAFVARELHDDLGQRVIALMLQLYQVSRQPGPVSSMRGQVEQLSHQFADVVKDIQAISYRLHSHKLDHLGLATAARAWCDDIRAQHADVAIGFTHENVPTNLPRQVAIGLFRVLQEALNNAVKHSRAKHVTVSVRGGVDLVELEVVDDGVGFDVEATMKGEGLGLVSMRERMNLVRGALVIDSRRGSGTRIVARVPLDPFAVSSEEDVNSA